MTFILSMANDNFVIQLSDRRVTYPPPENKIDEECDKCGVLFLLNARMAFGYSGIAEFGNFFTKKWLLNALQQSAPPDYTIGETLERLRSNAEELFASHRDLKKLDPVHKRLSIMFSGYININGGDQPGYAVLSNFQNMAQTKSLGKASRDFFLSYRRAAIDASNVSFVQRIGSWRGMKDHDVDALRSMLLGLKSSEAIVNKSVALMRRIADRAESANTIGKQLTSIVLRADRAGASSRYHSETIKPETYFPAELRLFPNHTTIISNCMLKPVEASTPPLSLPTVKMDAPCPCGNGKRFRHCHGRRRSAPNI